jgi:hypothetical protein
VIMATAERDGPTSPAELHIQYTRAADGSALRSGHLGRGAPLVYLAGSPWSHVELWQIPECRSWYARLAQKPAARSVRHAWHRSLHA